MADTLEDLAERMKHPAWIALQTRLRDESILYAACVSEGFCPKCRTRLLPPELPDRHGFCPTCDTAWRVGPRGEDGGHDWSRMSGWYYRERIAAGEGRLVAASRTDRQPPASASETKGGETPVEVIDSPTA